MLIQGGTTDRPSRPPHARRATEPKGTQKPGFSTPATQPVNPVDELLAEANRDLDRGAYAAAERSLTSALRQRPRDVRLLVQRAKAYIGLGQFSKGQDDCTEAIVINSTYAPAYNERGNACARQDDYDQAMLDYSKAIKLNPREPTYYENRARAHEHMGDDARAREDLEQAKRLRKGR